jgi:pilus assembly protein CpaB
MRPRSLIPLIIGLVVGFFAIKMGVDMVKHAQATEGDQKSVLLSAKQIDSAARIEESMLKSRQVPTSLSPADAFSDVKSLAGRVTIMPIPPNVPITKAMLAPPGAEPGLRARIPPGCRAVSVSVNEESAVAGFIVPGARVDVSAVCPRGGSSKLILCDAEVGAVGQSLNQLSPDGKSVKVTKSVTLFLKPEQVEILNAHSGKGLIRLALRGHNDRSGTDSLWSQLFRKAAEQSLPANDARPAKRHVVEVVRGSDVEQLVFIESPQRGRYQLVQDQLPPQQKQKNGKGRRDPSDGPMTEIAE